MSIAAASDPTAPAQPWLVLKFGGTSVSKRERWDTIGRLAKKRMDDTGGRVLVVVSALSGVTNALQAIADGDGDRAGRAAAVLIRSMVSARPVASPDSNCSPASSANSTSRPR